MQKYTPLKVEEYYIQYEVIAGHSKNYFFALSSAATWAE